MNIEKIRYYLKVMKRCHDLIEEQLNQGDDINIENILQSGSLKEPIIQSPPIAQPAYIPPLPETDFYHLRKKHIKDLLSIDVWPEAVPAHLEASASEEDQINRANAVLDMLVDVPILDTNFLDFGCGNGFTAKQALKIGAKTSTGYDLISSDAWNNSQGVIFSNNLKNITDKKYDIIMLYDVLDHCQSPLDLMKQVKSLLADNGSVFVRCHPWTSKHASHLYKKGINKAYIHLYLTWEEIIEEGFVPEFTRQELNPLVAYHWWFESNNLKIQTEIARRSPIPEFFFSGDFKQLLINEQKIEPNEVERFFSDMTIDFVDFKLK